MDGSKITKELFHEEVKNHKLAIVKDDGLYRHLDCSKGSFDQHFQIITWPGYLAITGDMGDFVFTRTDDMFAFFRNYKRDINPGYWAEKCVAESTRENGIKEFSVEQFRENVLSHARLVLDLDEDSELPEDIEEEIAPLLEAEDEWECVTAMRDFSSDKIDFTDFWEAPCTRGTWHYLWCLYAIVWAIAEYDRAKE